jgi:hypothetical protein
MYRLVVGYPVEEAESWNLSAASMKSVSGNI